MRMLGWLREHVAPIVSWTAAWTVFGATLGLASAVLSESTAGGSAWSYASLLGVFFGIAGISCALLYHGLALRGRPPRFLSRSATTLYGAAVGFLPVLIFVLDSAKRGSTLVNGVRDAILMTALGAATALYLRWRDKRRARAREILANPDARNLVDARQRTAAKRAEQPGR
jgi:hypothetical protein